MKAKWIGSLLTASLVFTGLFTGGCAKCSHAADEELAPNVCLPKGFAAVKGLTDCDFDADGWPVYIMNCKDGSLMTLIPETSFILGSNDAEPNESPAHCVTVGKFYIDVYEVNNAQFARFARKLCFKKDDRCLADELLSSETPRCFCARNWPVATDPCLKSRDCKFLNCAELDFNYFKEYWTPCVNDNHPARAVSFWEAWYYCRWVGKDLPTEAEWELAAKGPKGSRLYPWGNVEPDAQHRYCNYDGPNPKADGFEYTAPVSAFASGRSPFGVYNMAGNVWEWCKDRYDHNEYAVTEFARGNPRRLKGEIIREFNDPSGTTFADARVLRGGSYTSEIAKCRTTAREAAPPNFHGMNIGFRGVLRIR